MRAVFLTLITTVLSTSAWAADSCSKYADRPRMMTAIETVAKYTEYGLTEMCNHPYIMDVQADPTHIMVEGERIPHVRVQLHRETDSCLYMVRDSDQIITSAKCYSGT